MNLTSAFHWMHMRQISLADLEMHWEFPSQNMAWAEIKMDTLMLGLSNSNSKQLIFKPLIEICGCFDVWLTILQRFISNRCREFIIWSGAETNPAEQGSQREYESVHDQTRYHRTEQNDPHTQQIQIQRHKKDDFY